MNVGHHHKIRDLLVSERRFRAVEYIAMRHTFKYRTAPSCFNEKAFCYLHL